MIRFIRGNPDSLKIVPRTFRDNEDKTVVISEWADPKYPKYNLLFMVVRSLKPIGKYQGRSRGWNLIAPGIIKHVDGRYEARYYKVKREGKGKKK